jgi:hypothetical protein
MVNVLKWTGWSNMDAINAWTVGGYFTKMIHDPMDAWIALHLSWTIVSLSRNTQEAQ